jgi:hypothetical protein
MQAYPCVQPERQKVSCKPQGEEHAPRTKHTLGEPAACTLPQQVVPSAAVERVGIVGDVRHGYPTKHKAMVYAMLM